MLCLILIGTFASIIATLWKSDHWYLHGNPDLRQIMLDFKAKSSENAVLFSYGIGEAVNRGRFYADRKVVVLTNSREDIKIQNQLGGEYLQAGLVHFVAEEDDLIRWVCSTPDRNVILRRETYNSLSPESKPPHAHLIVENSSFLIIRLSCQ